MNQINNQGEHQQPEVAETQKDGLLRVLAIIGFIGLLIFIAWVGIKLVSMAPNAFSSLASVADTVQNYDPDTRTPVELTVVSSKSIINNDEAVTVSWNKPRTDGTFAFSYLCNDGVALDLRTANEGIRNLNCETNYNLGSANTIDLSISSERNRFSDVEYTIDFIPEGGDTPSGSYTGTIAVINASISPIAVIDTNTDNEETSEPETTPEPTPTPTPEPTTPAPTTPPAQTYIQEYVYAIPVSDPNGRTDLAVRAISVSTLDSANRYTNSGYLEAGERGALQIEVKNIGTKTSNSWDYTVVLPSGDTYKATNQVALRPNERTILTLGFTVPDSSPTTKQWSGTISTTADRTTSNNSFSAIAQIR